MAIFTHVFRGFTGCQRDTPGFRASQHCLDLIFSLFKRIASDGKGEIFASSKFMVFCSF